MFLLIFKQTNSGVPGGGRYIAPKSLVTAMIKRVTREITIICIINTAEIVRIDLAGVCTGQCIVISRLLVSVPCPGNYTVFDKKDFQTSTAAGQTLLSHAAVC